MDVTGVELALGAMHTANARCAQSLRQPSRAVNRLNTTASGVEIAAMVWDSAQNAQPSRTAHSVKRRSRVVIGAGFTAQLLAAALRAQKRRVMCLALRRRLDALGVEHIAQCKESARVHQSTWQKVVSQCRARGADSIAPILGHAQRHAGISMTQVTAQQLQMGVSGAARFARHPTTAHCAWT